MAAQPTASRHDPRAEREKEMLITRDGEIAGLRARQARDLMRTMRHYAVSLGELARLLDTSTTEGLTN